MQLENRKRMRITICISILLFCSIYEVKALERFAIDFHGGAGVISKSVVTQEQEKQYRHTLNEALDVGYQMLNNDAPATDLVVRDEYYIRLAFAKNISALMDYQNNSVEEGRREEIRKLTEPGGTGGVIAVDVNGNIATVFNTSGMFRGYMKSIGERKIAIFENE